ncbi:hypothetical protein CRUP_030280, partial [Coryphaenoides rupestris]
MTAPVNTSAGSVTFVDGTIFVTRIETTTTTISPTTQQAATQAASTPTPTTTEVTLVNVRVVFRSVGETFTAALLNPSSEAFRVRATTIQSELQPFYQRAFNSFKSLQVVAFRNGSIVNTLDTKFTVAPSIEDIGNVLLNAAGNITAFNIDTSSILVNGIETQSGASGSSGINKSCAFITSLMALLPWLLVS